MIFIELLMLSSSKRLKFYYLFLFAYLIFQFFFLSFLKMSNKDTRSNAFKILEIYKKLSIKLNERGKADNSGLYKVVEMKKLNSKAHDITVVSQCSANHFSFVENLYKSWEGPASVAVYSEVENIEVTLWDMARFIHCNSIKDFGIQLVVPIQDTYIKDYGFAHAFLSAADKSVSCYSPYMSVLKERKNYNWTFPYPVNLMRNVAKTSSMTDYIFVIDIDMVPSPNLREDFLTFVKLTELDKVVYVVPAFETFSDVPVPQDKVRLIKLVQSRLARPFYFVPCGNCQKLTRYDEWLSSENFSGTRVLHEIEWKHPWEPFFIAKRDVPDFDERFKQYGMNRVSQICELHIAGFKFLVMDNIYLIHKGFKNMEDFHVTKNKEMEANRRVYARFKIEVKYKYPDSERSC